MAHELTPLQITALTQAQKDIGRLTRLQVFALAKSDLIDVVEGSFVITPKATRALARSNRAQTLNKALPAVTDAALKILDKPEARASHRSIWNAAGGEARFTRNEVLDALRHLRDEGILANDKTSSNNFQIAWMRGPAAPQQDVTLSEDAPAEDAPVAHVSKEIAEAFEMFNLPNVVVID
jgi:hypothetical protein